MLNTTQTTLERQTFKDFEWLVEVGLHGEGFTLPRDMNKMLRRAQGDIIVSLQDCIELEGDALERIAALDFEKKAYTFAVGKMPTLGYGESALVSVLHENSTWDWRRYKGDEKVTANHWEADLAAAPRSMFFDIGGYDERYIEGWSFDNVEVAWRAEAAGYEFWVSPAVMGYAYDHDASMTHPHRKTLPFNDNRCNETRKRAERGDFKLSYL